MRPENYELFQQSQKAMIAIPENHELVVLTKLIDWQDLIEIAHSIRVHKLPDMRGPTPRYRELLGAVALMAYKRRTYREAEEMIRYYAPARYLCNMMDSTWNIDHVTIFDFTSIMGTEGMKKINSKILDIAMNKGLLDPKELMSDTTAQEAKIPYPTEVGLLTKYAQVMDRNIKKAGIKFTHLKEKVKKFFSKIKHIGRANRLFSKTKESKQKTLKKMFFMAKNMHNQIKKALSSCGQLKTVSQIELSRISEIMNTLLPQIQHFMETGFVAPRKIIHLFMDQVYSIVRGKSGKEVEFGLKWGINKLKGGFIMGFLMENFAHMSDKKFCMEAIRVHMEEFGEVPQTYGFDRGGYSRENIKKLKNLGIKNVGVAPKGKDKWQVSEKMKEHIISERAQVEAPIGTIKSARYGFTKPEARSEEAMVTYGFRSILGFNMNKLVREVIKKQMMAV
jgi:hypothetical protein